MRMNAIRHVRNGRECEIKGESLLPDLFCDNGEYS